MTHRGRRAAAARLQVLTEASDAFSAANRDLPSLFEAITQQVVRHLGDSCILAPRMPEQELLETVSVRHGDPALQERMQQTLSAPPFKLGEGLNGRVAQTGQAQWSASTPLEEPRSESPPDHPGGGAVVREKIVRGHGGTVEVASSREQGTTFTVRLPHV